MEEYSYMLDDIRNKLSGITDIILIQTHGFDAAGKCDRLFETASYFLDMKFNHPEAHKIAIGFDGDGTTITDGKWPLPSDMAVNLCSMLGENHQVEHGRSSCILIQAQVHEYAEDAEKYSNAVQNRFRSNEKLKVSFNDNESFFTFVYHQPATKIEHKKHFTGQLPINRGSYTKTVNGSKEYGGYNNEAHDFVGSTAVWDRLLIDNILPNNINVHLLTIWNHELGNFQASITGRTYNAVEAGLLGRVNMMTFMCGQVIDICDNIDKKDIDANKEAIPHKRSRCRNIQKKTMNKTR